MGTNTIKSTMGIPETLIPVTKTFLPPIEEYTAVLKRAWDKQWMTNRGELICELEDKLKEILEVENIIITTNGTLPLQIAIKALELKGEIITTPFSYVATTSAIVWENCKPVFADIDPLYFTIDETKIEEKITKDTSAIMATHVFGNPCNVEVIEAIAKKHNLKVIYDAAHCYGVRYKNKTVFNFGDVSTCSFHATKIFHTGEGGAMIANDAELNQKLFFHHNFGHKTQLDFYGLGINAKTSELQAAMGLTLLPYMEEVFASRKAVVDYYNEHLNTDRLKKLTLRPETQWNYCYYPVVFESETILESVIKELQQHNIVPRRYFYPSLNMLPYQYEPGTMPVSEALSKTILCLPLYAGLEIENMDRIIQVINQQLS